MFVVGYNRCRRFARQLSNKYCDWKKSSFSGSFKQIIEISLIGTGGACMFRFDQYNYCQLSKGRNESVLNNMHCADWYNVNTCIYKCKREREKTINTSFLCSAMHFGLDIQCLFLSILLSLCSPFTQRKLCNMQHVYYLSLMTMSLLLSNFEFKFQRK